MSIIIRPTTGPCSTSTSTGSSYPWQDADVLDAAGLNAAFAAAYDAAAAASAAAASASSTATASFANVGRNLLHNPLFNVAQRGAGPFSAGGYTLDRWNIFTNTDTIAVSRQAFALGGVPGDEAARYALTNTFTGNAAAAACNFLIQYIEDVRRLSNKTVTVSFWATAAGGTPKLGVSLDQNFGTGGSPSAQAQGTGQSVTLSTTYTRYSLTFTLPSVVGKTLGTAGNDNTEINFWYSSGANNNTRSGGVGVQSNTISLWGVQLEIGTAATPLEKLDYGYDLRNCQRFYQVYAPLGLDGYGLAGQAVLENYLFPQMRANPTVTFSGTSYSNASALAVSTIAANNLRAQITATATGSTFASFNLALSADL